MVQYNGQITIIELEMLLYGYVTSAERCLTQGSVHHSRVNATNVIHDLIK